MASNYDNQIVDEKITSTMLIEQKADLSSEARRGRSVSVSRLSETIYGYYTGQKQKRLHCLDDASAYGVLTHLIIRTRSDHGHTLFSSATR